MRGFGEWDAMVRELAGWQPPQMQRVIRWPLAEALASYEQKLRDDARHDYEFAVLCWTVGAAMGSKAKPPQMPAILRET